ncbi:MULTISPECIES: hypothetical protein [Microbacterium]|uniref:hypothetical protein n=1 Tax=Microbacterium TaxID=33882 RepID=UPI002788B989|nr:MULTISPECIES: hypothetical protein [Microbacterium]MDQ1082193.1 hypothetical protein [Microbacterium sp. SORGH_AS_0344]MDQ1169036.1 hypothetical protein [Microbacterium proteolyticum]
MPVPREVRDAFGTWTVRRAWPSSRGYDLELEHADGRIRAGRWRDGQQELSPVGRDRHLPARAEAAAAGTVISWRRGRRAVLRTHDDSGYLKVVRPEAVASLARAHADAGSFRGGFVTPEVTVRDAAGCVHLSRISGRTLHDLGADARLTDDDVCAAWSGWARGWGEVLAMPPGGEGAVHTPDDEAAVLLRWRDHAVAAGSRAATAAAFDRAAQALLVDAGGHFVPAHRDLHDKQVLWDGRRAGLIDLDTAARAEPALDLANLRAHVAWRHAQGRMSASRAEAARSAVDRVASRAGVDPRRMNAYETSSRLRLGAVYLFRPAWHATARRWLALHAGQTRR